MCAKPQGHGYVEMEVCAENPFFSSGSILRGHEFHHSRLIWSKEPAFAFRARRGQGINGKDDGIIYKNMFAAYTHLHAAAAPEWAKAFVGLVAKEKRRNPAISALGLARKNTMKNLKGL